MAKPTIVTRAGKGSALTWTEGDANFTNLQDATVTIQAGTGGTNVTSDLNGTITLVAGTNVTLSGDNTAKTVTINSSSTLDGLSDVVVTAAATGDLLYYDGTNWVDQPASSTTVGVASTVTITSDTTTNATYYPLFASGGNGNLSPRTDVGGLAYNPSTNTLTAGAFVGPIGSSSQSTGRFTSLQFNSLIETGGTASNASGAYTYAPNAANGTVQTLNMSTATSLTFNGFTSPVAGQSLTIIVTNNATVSTITSTMLWAGGVKTLTGTIGAIDIITVYYNGLNYYASIAKGFA